MTHEPRRLVAEERRAAADLFSGALLHGPVEDARWERLEPGLDPDRTWGVHEGGAIVATALSFPTRTAVPGGAVLDLAAVTQVGVRADRTRRGLLTAVMRAQLGDLDEPLAALHATESRIYGRFGYGVATRGRGITVRPRHGWRAAWPAGEIRLLAREGTIPVLRDVHERIALLRPGGIERPDTWWEASVGGLLKESTAVLAAVHTGPDGDDGYLVASAARDSHVAGTLQVRDLHAADEAARAALWRFVTGVDLADSVTAFLRPVDEPLDLLLADPRDVTVTDQSDDLWVRLVDVPTALAARSWGAADPVLLGVHDPFLPDNAGVYRIAGGAAERVGPIGGPVHPEIECDVGALAMAYLGDRRPSELVATGWWTATDRTAVARAEKAFFTSTVPWCGTMF